MFFGFIFVFFLFGIVLGTNDGKVEILVTSQIPRISSVKEYSEYLFQSNPMSFWDFTKEIVEKMTDQQIMEKYGKNDPMLHYSLLTRYYSPRVQVMQSSGYLVANDMLQNQTNVDSFIVCHDGKESVLFQNVEEYKGKDSPYVSSSVEFILDDSYDHKHHDGKGDTVCFLYGDLDNPQSFKLMDEELRKDEEVTYLFRHFSQHSLLRRDIMSLQHEKSYFQDLLPMQGYLAELQIKNMEYKTIDEKDMEAEADHIMGIHFDTLFERYPDEKDELKVAKQHLHSQNDNTIQIWEMKDFGIQAFTHIMSSSKPADALIQVSQNFPSFMTALSKIPVESTVKRLLVNNENGLMHGENYVSVSGIPLDLNRISIHTLYDIIAEEHVLKKKFIDSLKSLRGTDDISSVVSELLYERPEKKQEFRFNIFHSNEGNPFVSYLNDVENDSRYGNFPKSLNDMLYPPYYGRLRFSRRNVFEALFIIDPSSHSGLNILLQVSQLVLRGYPLRFGFVFVAEQEMLQEFGKVEMVGSNPVELSPGSLLATIGNYLSNNLQAFSQFFSTILHHPSAISNREEILNIFKNFGSVDDLSDASVKTLSAIQFIKSRGISPEQIPSLLFNGKFLLLKEVRNYNQFIMEQVNKEYPVIQNLITSKILKDNQKDLQNVIRKQFEAFSTYHPAINEKNPTYVLIDKDAKDDKTDLGHSRGTSMIPFNENYFFRDNGETKDVLFSYVLCTDMNQSIDLLLNAFAYTLNSKFSRITAYHFGDSLSDEGKRIQSIALDQSLSLDDAIKYLKSDKQYSGTSDTGDNPFCRYISSKKPGYAHYIFLNGRILGVESEFNHFSHLERIEESIPKFLKEKLPDVTVDQNFELSVFLNYDRVKNGARKMHQFSWESINLHGKSHLPLIQAVINPLSVQGAQWSQIVYQLNKYLDFPVDIVLNPQIEYTEIPLKSWFRFVFDLEPEFNERGQISMKKAFFDDLPKKKILTTIIEPPETWLLESTYALYDMDNINLETVSEEVLKARYQVENIVITGSCLDETTSVFPRGLQLQLGNESYDHVEDTIVMANLGYFQLKANPQTFFLGLQGRSKKIFDVSSVKVGTFYQSEHVGQMPSLQAQDQIRLPIIHWDGPFLNIVVKRKPGFEREEILKEGKVSFWSKVRGSFKAGNEKKIHIFTVATGHLYEKLMRVMMLSVTKRTKNVKFWIIKNYLSPQFKEMMPHMAKQYGFEYGFVTYKWPFWLRKQHTKQRIIWAYKILFLDVLFPQEVERIIYMDADQVCRTDMSELYNMDIQGRAVAYTPFCSDRPEMDGYAFWKQGYWKGHLRGLPYHISALYLVDLFQLRRQYAADQYRMFYEQLSADPNSLANLDQDLPNYAQHSVPIFSLPQEWLWCETWCSQNSKKKAKTIDLCNNPETKEHKIQAARRICEETEELDREINIEFPKTVNAFY